ncbi:DUF7522 family protein [Haloarchaeobius amylolyticus]|uniref:DUF7522 family protein n=1 Tax=Haloarchaeobius amylolyticus TaxID=1198296 RepID=UPI002270086C|nr:hypothetical protein [Haloarchaeobius amylolyticus]
MATLLTEREEDRLVSACRTTVGDSLRSITYFTRDDFEQLYLRSDLERDADLSTFVGHEWREFKTTQAAYETSELGEYEYTIRKFENGFLVRMTTDSGGVFVTTDGLTLSNFDELAMAAKGVLEDHEH